MMKLAVGLALLILAALLAAVGWVLAKPKWHWDPPLVDDAEDDEWLVEPPDPSIWAGVPRSSWGSGSPPSVTSRSDNGTGLFV